MNKYQIASAVVDEYIALLDKKYENDQYKYPCKTGHLQEALVWAVAEGVEAIQERIKRLKSEQEISDA